MASLCKSQQCSIERRGFRLELDAWRHKLIHCVGFETILEGLFGPALLNDLSLFKDCEPTGVCDWSFDENCLFCCLRREKVKEHLAGFHKPINEPGHENFLKQEQAKIIRLERQAEEFINAVFYKKDNPRISDPNIPLVARQIMQRMIRQFAAEYTSKNSSTQDSIRPNSTKNQSLPKSPSRQSSPSPATTQNPVLSKLLMADQDSPLDLTVKKPHLEEPCEQADGVLDLSTKKSPCSGSPNSSISPSTSNTIGNGAQDTERKAIDPNNSTNLSLEMFMAKLCSHHQKQFILVLNNLCTEESIMKSRSRSASVSEIENANLGDHDHSSCENNANLSPVKKDKYFPESCLNTPTDVCEDSCPCKMSHCSNYLSKVPCSLESKADHANNVSYAADQTITNNPVGIPSTEEISGTIIAKVSDVSQTIFLEHCVLSHSNCTLNMHNDSPGSELPTDIPKIENKENTQYVNPKQAFMDCNDCILKQEHSVTTMTAKKLGNLCESPFHRLTDHSGPTLQKVKLHENKRLKTVKCKNSRQMVTNDCGKQCDVVYISEPITTECHFENQKSVVCARNTARKSTRGYLISGDCCELSTVRTLVKSSKVEEKGNSALHISEALIIPNDLIKTLPSTDVVSLIHVEESVETDRDNPIPQNAEMKDLIADSLSIESEKQNQSLALNKESVDNVSDSLIAVFSLTQDEPKKLHVSSNHTANEPALNEHDDEIPKMKLISSVVNIDGQSLSLNDHDKSRTELALDPDFYFSRSNNLCSKDGSATPSLDMEITVSLNDNHTSPRSYPRNTAIEEASANLKYNHDIPSTAYPSTLGTADKDIPVIGSSSLNDIKILPEDSSETVIADPVTSDQLLSINISSKTISDILPEDNSEGQISKSSQIDPTSSGSVNEFPKHFVQCVVKKNAYLMMDSNIENVKDCQSLNLNNSVEMEKKENVQPPTINTLGPTKCFQTPLNMCAKIVENNRLEANVSEETLHHCHTVSSGCSKYDTVNDALKTKEVTGENTDAVNSNKIDNLLTSNKNSFKHLTPLKRHKKLPAPTDRCLRSSESHDDSVLHKIPFLRVLLSYVQGTNSAQRSVVLRTEDTPCSDTVISSVDDSSNDESYFAFFLNSHCRKGKPLFYERIPKSTCFKMSENITVCLKIGSDKRIISFAKEHHNCLNMADANCKCGATSSKNTCQLEKCKESQSENATNSGCLTKSSTTHIAENSLKDKMKCCKSSKLKNCSPRNKKINSSNKRINRPKFIDWCSEEENQERISSFNDKYTDVHKNWVSLERETVNVTKTKNKSDRLKEIWKTKKRIRRPKSNQDTPKCSPMQMLFMNSFKFSDVCGWFMETTETKSLVIVKKLNTRIPEEHQLPMMPSPKYSSQSLYPHMLQAQRLKKHLKKFASVIPALNNIKTENSLNTLVSNSGELVHEVTDTVKGPNDCKKQEPHSKAKKTAPLHILKKYNRLQENLNSQSYTMNKNKVCMANAKRKASNSDNKKAVSSSDLSLGKAPKARTSKSLIVKKCKRRNKSDCLEESVAQPNKKRKIQAKQRFLKNGPHVHEKAAPTKSKVSKMSKIHSPSSSQSPKKQVGKAGVFKTSVMKGKAKTPMQKQSLKSQIVIKHQTRSAKLSQAPSKVSDSPKITSLSSSHRKKDRCKKISTVSAKNKRNVASRVRHNKQRSQLEPPTRKGRSLEFK